MVEKLVMGGGERKREGGEEEEKRKTECEQEKHRAIRQGCILF